MFPDDHTNISEIVVKIPKLAEDFRERYDYLLTKDRQTAGYLA